MKSSKRINHIFKILEDSFSEVIHSESKTLFVDYPEISDLKTCNLPNISYYSSRIKLTSDAQTLGIKTPNDIKKKYNIIVISITKSKEEALGKIAVGYHNAIEGGLIVLEGNKRDGIDSIYKILSGIVPIEYSGSKSHGKMIVVKVTSEKIHFFSKWLKFSKPSLNEDGFYTMPGLFSYKKADAGSLFLSSIFTEHLHGHVLDLGAGWGFLSANLLTKCPSIKSITLVDHDRRAIDCSKLNVPFRNAKFKWLDINNLGDLEIKFDTTICNPPFHCNNVKNIELGMNFIRAAHQNLKNSGTLFLVANLQLPYENLIRSLFNSFELHSQNNYFKIILAKNPKRKYGRNIV